MVLFTKPLHEASENIFITMDELFAKKFTSQPRLSIVSIVLAPIVVLHSMKRASLSFLAVFHFQFFKHISSNVKFFSTLSIKHLRWWIPFHGLTTSLLLLFHLFSNNVHWLHSLSYEHIKNESKALQDYYFCCSWVRFV